MIVSLVWTRDNIHLHRSSVVDRAIGDAISFSDHPDFLPNMTPREVFSEGSFGGTYWRPIFSGVTSLRYAEQHLEFDWWDGIDDALLISEKYDKSLNRFGVKCGTSLDMWESKDWIRHQDPYGWVQWYCRFFSGRRSEDDDRQIRRWKAFAGEKGRFRNQLINLIISRGSNYDDETVSPVIRQSLQHWAYRLTNSDFEDASLKKWKSEMG